MRTKKKTPYLLFGFVFCVVYIILSARPLGKEWQLVPQWRIDINNATAEGSVQDVAKAVPFKMRQNMGYFDKDGRMLRLISFPFKASIAQGRYVQYAADARDTPFYNSDGTAAGTLEGSGFPLFEDERIFLFAPGGGSFAQLGQDGQQVWHYGGTVPITAFDSSDAACVAGFADGTVKEFSPEGRILQEFAPGGSNINVILGAGVSHGGDMIASVSGQDRQRFVLAKKNGAQTKIVFHKYINGDVHQRLVQFTADDSVVYYDTASTLGAVNTRTYKSAEIPINGQAVSLKECGVLRFVLTRGEAIKEKGGKSSAQTDSAKEVIDGGEGIDGGREYTVYIVEKFDTVIGSFNFKAHNAFIRTDDDSLYVGSDDAISRIKVEKK